MKTQEQKQKIIKITAISVGILSILCGIATFCGIYFTTKDYRLVKNDYDIFLNKDKIENDKLDYVYRSDSKEYFTKIDDGYRIELDSIIDNNPSFKSNDYKINISYQAMIVEQDPDNSTNYPNLYLVNKDQSVKERLSYSNQNATIVENIFFNDSTDYLELKFEHTEETKWVLDVEKIALQFYSLKK